MKTDMEFKRVSFSRGLRWLPAGTELLFSGLGPLAGVAALWLLVSLVAVVPVIGQAMLALFTPLLTAGVLKACDETAGGNRPMPTVLFAAWSDPVRRGGLLLVGLWGIVGSVISFSLLAIWLGAQLGPEQLEAAMASQEDLINALAGASIGGGLVLAALALALVLATMYFAIPLIMFARAPVIGSLLTSLRAVVVNWAAFLGLGVAAMLFIGGLVLVLLLVATVLNLAFGNVGAMLTQVLVLVITMFVQMVMAATQYVAFRDVFEIDQPASSEGDGDDGRILA